jgi:hypothetical protein
MLNVVGNGLVEIDLAGRVAGKPEKGADPNVGADVDNDFELPGHDVILSAENQVERGKIFDMEEMYRLFSGGSPDVHVDRVGPCRKQFPVENACRVLVDI